MMHAHNVFKLLELVGAVQRLRRMPQALLPEGKIKPSLHLFKERNH